METAAAVCWNMQKEMEKQEIRQKKKKKKEEFVQF